MKTFTKIWRIISSVFTKSFTINVQEIGDIYQGGYIFYIDETGEDGLVAAVEDLGQFQCGCNGTQIGAYGVDIGTGYQNTLDIVVLTPRLGYQIRLSEDINQFNLSYKLNY